MRLWPLVAGVAVGSAAWLVYGALVEANKIVVERRRLRLPGWPARLAGYKIALLADFHIRDEYTVEQSMRAVALALDEDPDMVVLAGDFVGYWKERSAWLLEPVLEPFLLMEGKAVAVPGNHDYWAGDGAWLGPILDQFNIRFLRNEVWSRDGITWVGIDSTNAERAEPVAPMLAANESADPVIVVWHEPDAVEDLPPGANLMLAGHSHGGQWKFPWGWIPMRTKYGGTYMDGFYPEAPTPLYVTRGIGTTGPPARLGALAEVSILTIDPA